MHNGAGRNAGVIASNAARDERKVQGSSPVGHPAPASPFTAPLSAPTQSADLLLASGLYESSEIGVSRREELRLDVDGGTADGGERTSSMAFLR